MFFCTCPPDLEDVADDYCMGRLDTETAQAFEDHYLTCPACAQVAADTLSFVQAFREAETIRSGKKHPDLTFR